MSGRLLSRSYKYADTMIGEIRAKSSTAEYGRKVCGRLDKEPKDSTPITHLTLRDAGNASRSRLLFISLTERSVGLALQASSSNGRWNLHSYKLDKTGKVYSSEYDDIPCFSLPHHLGHSCINVITGHCYALDTFTLMRPEVSAVDQQLHSSAAKR
jgi:hypothetical protein